MDSSSSRTRWALTGALALLSLAAVAYYLTSSPSSSSSSSKGDASTGKKKQQSAKKSKQEEKEKEATASDKAPAAPSKTATPTPAAAAAAPAPTPAASVVVEEDGADDEEDDATESVEELTKRYDDALRLAKKYLQGEKYSTAAAKFSEAIDLASRIPSATKDLVTLYNNRSAMFEKNNELDASLQDIMIVLTLDTKHQKARARRARILERQGDFEGALDDCVFCSILEGASGQPASNTTKIVELCKKVSEPEVRRHVERIRSSSRAVPNKAYCRSYFESFSSFHEWKQIYETVDRDDLVRRSYTESDLSPMDVARKELADALDLIKLDASRQNFNKAFAHMERCQAIIDEGGLASDAQSQLAIAQLEDMQGTEAHLRCNLTAARKSFITALARLGADPALLAALDVESKDITSIAPLNLGISEEAHLTCASEIILKLASTYIELGEQNKASLLYTSILSALSEGSQLKPWVLIHRATLHVSRDDQGNIRANAIEDAVVDLEEVLRATSGVTKTSERDAPVSLNCRVAALLKIVHVLSQTKVQMGLQPTEEEVARVTACIQEAKTLAPSNESVLLLEADLMSINGETDSALAKCDDVILLSDGTDSIPYVIKANVLMQKALLQVSMAQAQGSQEMLMMAQTTMREVESIFAEAIKVEPNGLEAFAQYAQLKSMLGEYEASLTYLEKALGNARSRDEVQELCVMRAQTQAQCKAIEEFKSSV